VSSAVVAPSFKPDSYFFRWIRQAIPHSLVALETSEGPTNSFLNHLLDEGWRAQLLESNQALYVHLQDKWKQAPQIHCVSFDPKSPLAGIVKDGGIPKDFGLLILNSPERRSEHIKELQESGFEPRLIAIKDASELSSDRCPLYEILIAAGYRFAGTQHQFSLWTLTQTSEDLSATPSSEFPHSICSDLGMVCFDAAGNQNRLGAAGHLEVEISGWAILDASQPVPPHVYVQMTDVRTGHTDYITAARFPRLDVANHFNNPHLLMSGFETAIPMVAFHPNGLRIRIIQGDGQKYYASETELTIDRGFEDFELTARQGLARKFLRGSGIEIGALQRKLELPYGCSVRYLDRMLLTDLFEHYPEMRQFPLQAPDLVDDGEQLTTIAENSLDFLVANHFFEHSENPIQTMKNFLRVLKPHGILFMAVPDKRYTFDADRPSTNFKTIKVTYESGVRPDRTHLYREWVELAEMNSGPERESRIAALLHENYSIHFNVWSADELLSFLLRARQEFALPFNISSVVCSDNETIVLLERAA
jgi:SAM-dependent methyltransferase